MGKKSSAFFRHRGAAVGAAVVLLVVLMAVFAPLIAPYDPAAVAMAIRFQPPSPHHLLGTDSFGRDILSRIIYGSRVSVEVASISVGLAAGIGIVLGAVAGFFGGVIDTIIMRIVDVFMAFPAILLALTLVAVLGPSAGSVMIALGLVYWTTYARVIRASVLAIKNEDFVEANRALGSAWVRTLFRHIVPNAIGPVIVVATVGMGAAITAEAALSFLGLGVQPPTPSWGAILNTGLHFLQRSPYLSTFPGLAIMVTVLGFNLLGDGLRDLLDPRKTS